MAYGVWRRTGKWARHLAIASIVLVPNIAFAAAPRNFAELAETVVRIIDSATGVLIVAGFVVYFWGIWENILEFEEDNEKRKAYFWWGLVVLFVMVSIWGIINLLKNTIFGDGTYGIGIDVSIFASAATALFV